MTPQAVQLQPVAPAAGSSAAEANRSGNGGGEFSGLLGSQLSNAPASAQTDADTASPEKDFAADGNDLPSAIPTDPETGDGMEAPSDGTVPIEALLENSGVAQDGIVTESEMVQGDLETSEGVAEELLAPWGQAATVIRPEHAQGLGPEQAPGHLMQLESGNPPAIGRPMTAPPTEQTEPNHPVETLEQLEPVELRAQSIRLVESVELEGGNPPVVGRPMTAPPMEQTESSHSVETLEQPKPAELIAQHIKPVEPAEVTDTNPAVDEEPAENTNPIPFIASGKGQPELTPLVAEARPGQFDPTGPARTLFTSPQPRVETAMPPASPATANPAATAPVQPVAAEGEGFDDLMQQGFSQMRDQAGIRLQQQAADEGTRGFNHLLNQINARPVATTAATALETASALMQQTKPLDVPVGGRGWDQGVGERIQWMLGRGVQQAEIKLNPQHLGPLEIRVSMLNDQANVTIMAQQSMTREALEASLPRLREMMQDANVNLGSVDVGRRETAQQQGQGGGRNGSDNDSGFFAGPGEEIPDEAAVGTVRQESRGLVDDFA